MKKEISQEQKQKWLGSLTPITDFKNLKLDTVIYHKDTKNIDDYCIFKYIEGGDTIFYKNDSGLCNTKTLNGWYHYIPFRFMPLPFVRLEYQNCMVAEALIAIKEKRYRLPEFQRPLVWTETQKIKFIESLYMGFSVGYYMVTSFRYINNSQLSEHSDILIDGQQRLNALECYVNNEFPVYGYLWDEIAKIDQRFFKQQIFGRCIIQEETPKEKLKYMYDLLNFAGTKHSDSQRALGKYTYGDLIMFVHDNKDMSGLFIEYNSEDVSECFVLVNNQEIKISLNEIK